mmetsp:Transcript_20170/g.29941  ORF Transcript_20170/g.29941 Transcript_20170/m.29941 type:complete len:228 (+) Transcript_20170:148-831(+)
MPFVSSLSPLLTHHPEQKRMPSDNLVDLNDNMVRAIIDFLTIDIELVRFARISERFAGLVLAHISWKIREFWQTDSLLNHVVERASFLQQHIPAVLDRVTKLIGTMQSQLEFLRTIPPEELVEELPLEALREMDSKILKFEEENKRLRILQSLAQTSPMCHNWSQELSSSSEHRTLSEREMLMLIAESVNMFVMLQELSRTARSIDCQQMTRTVESVVQKELHLYKH